MTTADLLESTDERESILARLMRAYRLSRVEAEYMLETFGDGEPDTTGEDSPNEA